MDASIAAADGNFILNRSYSCAMRGLELQDVVAVGGMVDGPSLNDYIFGLGWRWSNLTHSMTLQRQGEGYCRVYRYQLNTAVQVLGSDE